jgi:hypothetical protein
VKFARSHSGAHMAFESGEVDVEHTALYQSKARPQSAGAHRVTSHPQRAKMLKALGEDASVLRAEGISATDAKNAGFTSYELVSGGYSSEELHAAGFAARAPAKAGSSKIAPET